MQRVHMDALCELAPATRPAPRRLEQPRSPPDGCRHLFVMLDGAGISRPVALAPMSPKDRPPPARRQSAAATARFHVALPRPLRYAADMVARAPVGLGDQLGDRPP